MTKRDWMSVGLKCALLTMAVRFFSEAVYASFETMRNIFGGRDLGRSIVDVVGLAVLCAISIIFLRWSEVLAARAVPEDGEWAPGEKHRVIFLVACRVAGVVVLFTTVSGAFVTLMYWLGYDWAREVQTYGALWGVPASILLRTVGWCVQILFALYLLFGAKWLVRAAFVLDRGDPAPEETDREILGIGRTPEVFSLALRVAGVVFLALKSVTVLEYLVFRVFPLTAQAYSTPVKWNQILDAAFILLVCIYLIVGAPGLVKLVFRKRGGTNPAEEAP